MAGVYIVDYKDRLSETNSHGFYDPLLSNEDGGSEHGNKDFENIRKDVSDHDKDERPRDDSESETTVVSQMRDKNDKSDDSPDEDNSGQKEVIPQNDQTLQKTL